MSAFFGLRAFYTDHENEECGEGRLIGFASRDNNLSVVIQTPNEELINIPLRDIDLGVSSNDLP